MRRLILGIGLLAATELALLLLAAGSVGGWPVIFWCMATGLAGAAIVRAQGLALMARLAQRSEPALPRAALEAALFALAGVLMLVPGLLSDALGLALAVPAVRRRLALRLALADGGARGAVIEGEYWRHPPH